MKRQLFRICVALVAILGLGPILDAQAPNQSVLVTQTVAGVKFSTLPGFSIERVNPPDKNDSYVAITFDSQGRLAVSKEQDHPRYLFDNDKDGIYETEKVISDKVRNCQGLWFDGPTLYASCVLVEAAAELAAKTPPAPGGRGGAQAGLPNRPAAVVKLVDTNGDDVADTMEVLGQAGSIQEHGPHAIRRRPDGGMAVIVGNNETIADNALDLTSPVLRDKDAQFLPYFANFGQSAREGAHSAIFDWNPSDKKFRVFAGGNRNAYDFAYNISGEAFLFDSDMEWDIGLPWYRDVRTAHEVLNGNYGYRNGSGKYPAYYFDSLPPVRDLGRGSPVGVEFYTSYAYPKEFFDNLFEADWSRGRLLYTALTPAGATYTARTDRAEFVHGEPFNITDVEVGPDGIDVFHDRRTRHVRRPVAPALQGGAARRAGHDRCARHRPAAAAAFELRLGGHRAREGVDGRRLRRRAREAGAQRLGRAGRSRARGLRDAAPRCRAGAGAPAGAGVRQECRGAGRGGLTSPACRETAARAVAAAALKDADPVVRRRAAEALVRLGQTPGQPSIAPVNDIYALLNDRDRFVRWAARIAIEHTERTAWKDRVLKETNPLGALEGMLAYVRTRQWRGSAAGARTAARHAAPDQPLDRGQAPPLSRPDVHHDRDQGRHDPGPAGTAARADRRSVSGKGRAPQSRARADAGIRRHAFRRSASCSRRYRRAMRTRSCSCSTSTRCG